MSIFNFQFSIFDFRFSIRAAAGGWTALQSFLMSSEAHMNVRILLLLAALPILAADEPASKVKQDAKEVGRQVAAAGKEVGKAAKAAGKGVAEAARAVGHGVKEGVKGD
jgi:hypothetical protein